MLVAKDGEEAMSSPAQTTIDVLLTDLTMPKVGGREVRSGCANHSLG